MRRIMLLAMMFLTSCSPDRSVRQITTIPSEKTVVYEPAVDDLFDPSLTIFSGQGAENAILLLLPMSGSNAAVGRGILNACILANAKISPKNVDFFVIDTANSNLEKFNLYDEFRNKNLKTIIGPVFFHEAKQYSTLFPNIPILTFSNNIKANNDHVVACGMSPRNEIGTLFSFAASKNINSFLLILPEGEFGDQILADARKEADKHGLGDDMEVVRYASFSSKDAMKCLRTSGKKAAFVIDPLLDASKLKNTYVFTLSSSALANGNAWNGSIFAFADNPEQKEFMEEYQNLFGKTPTILDIIAYDLTKVACQSIEDEKSIFERNYSGCLGKFSIKKGQGLNRYLGVFCLQNSQRIEIDAE
jgi:ABC-type branched-subunit amino acid transport system substrate-binding protein